MSKKGSDGEGFKWGVFQVLEPARPEDTLRFHSPHSGRIIPSSFSTSRALIRIPSAAPKTISSMNCSAAHVSGGALASGAFPARLPRRKPRTLPTRTRGMFDGALPRTQYQFDAVCRRPLAPVPRLVAENMEIYRGRFPGRAGARAHETIYKPLSCDAQKAIAAPMSSSGCRSSSTALVRATCICPEAASPGLHYRRSLRNECGGGTVRVAVELLEQLGLRGRAQQALCRRLSSRNITADRPRGPACVQIEINAGLYVDEAP